MIIISSLYVHGEWLFLRSGGSIAQRQNLFDVLHDVCVLVGVLHDEVVREQLLVVGSSVDVFLEAHVDEALERVGEDAGRQLRRVLRDDLLELLERRAPGGVGELSGGHFDHADAQRPHIAADVVVADAGALRIDSLRSHVRFAAGVDCLRHRVHQVSGNPEITHFHFAAAVDH